MSGEQQQSNLDLSHGIAASTLSDGGMIQGRVGDKEVVLARSGNELFAIRRALFALSRPARGGAHRRRHGALSVASRLFQPAHGRGAARAGAGSDCLLARRSRG